MEMSKKRRAIELLKDALILVLSCSAVWLAFRTPLSAPMRELFREEGAQAAPGAGQGDSRGTGALPMAMVVNVPGSEQVPEGAEGTRCGLQYDQAACQELFRRVAGPLVETLSSAGAPERISRRQWEETLTSGLGVYLDSSVRAGRLAVRGGDPFGGPGAAHGPYNVGGRTGRLLPGRGQRQLLPLPLPGGRLLLLGGGLVRTDGQRGLFCL